MHQRGWIKVDYAQMPIRRNRNRLPRKNNHARGCQASKGKYYKLPRKNQIPEIQKGPCNDILDSLITTETTFRDCQKNWFPSFNYSRRTRRS